MQYLPHHPVKLRSVSRSIGVLSNADSRLSAEVEHVGTAHTITAL
jgi:hypothetical protein